MRGCAAAADVPHVTRRITAFAARRWPSSGPSRGLVAAAIALAVVDVALARSTSVVPGTVTGSAAVAALLARRGAADTGPSRRSSAAAPVTMVFAVALAVPAIVSALRWSGLGGDRFSAVVVADVVAFPPLFVAVMLIAREQVRALTRAAWLDGVVAAAVIAAYASWGAEELAPTPSLPAPVLALALAAPALDLLVLAIASAARNVLGSAAGREWRLLLRVGAVGLVSNSVAVALELLGGGAAPWWVAALAAPVLAYAIVAVAWQPARPLEQHANSSWLVLSGPLAMGTVAMVPLVVDDLRAVPPMATAAALAAMVGVGVRVALSARELVSMAESRRLARVDDLTGMANRRWFYEHLGQRCLDAPGRENGPLTVLRIDLDRFKAINDALGHSAGDRVIQLVARRLRRTIPGEAFIGRLGGDEFACSLPGGRDEASRVAELLRDAFADPLVLDDLAVHVAVTIGVACWPDHGRGVDDVMAASDLALVRAKSTSAGLAFYDPRNDVGLSEAVELTAALRAGLGRGELVPYFQPKVDLATGALLGAEALVRWRHPERGVLAPAAFLGHAERAGLVPVLTSHMIDGALARVAEWRASGAELCVAVNITSASLVDDRFPEQVTDALRRHGLAPGALTLEITEDTVMLDPERALAMLHRLRAIGVGIAIDDYGTGRASLAYLRDIPATELKLDRSFCMRLLSDPQVAAIVASTISLGRALGLAVVAEGIESAEIGDALAELGCHIGQGYHFGRPEPAEVIAQLVVSAGVAAADSAAAAAAEEPAAGETAEALRPTV